MARIAGVSIPTDKQVKYALTYVYGIGPTRSDQILEKTGIDPTQRVKDLNETELASIRKVISDDYTVEGELRRVVTTNLKRLRDINSYRGMRHKANLPARGQRTKTNARTKRGKKVAVGGVRNKAPTKT